MLKALMSEAEKIINELIEAADLKAGNLVVVGCSSSEVGGYKIGSHSTFEIAEAIFEGIYPVLKEKGIFLASQCCEHLNRAVIMEREIAEKSGLEIVSVVPKPKAGGSWATVTFGEMENPVAVEFVKADAGLDIGGTLIGMHLKHVAVPVRLSVDKLGEANILCAKTRPKYIGGPRAMYE